MSKQVIKMIAWILVIIGGLNIGLSELGFDVLGMILGGIPIVLTILNYLIGIAALYGAYMMATKSY